MRPRIAGALLLAAVATLVAAAGSRSVWWQASHEPKSYPGTDFQILWAAGQGMEDGLAVHEPDVLSAIGRARTGRPVTPFSAGLPIVARTVALSGDEFVPAYRAWWRLTVALLVLSAALLAAALAACGLGVLAPAAALLVLGLNEGTLATLSFNSTNALALAALCGALLAAVRGRAVLEGALLAVAAVAKTSPALLVVVAALCGRWRVVLAAAAGLLVLLLASVAWAGGDVHASWLASVLPALGYAPDLPAGHFDNSLHLWNAAPAGLLARKALESDLPRGAARAAAWLVTGLVLLSLRAAVRSPPSADDASHRDGGEGPPAPEASRRGAEPALPRQRTWEYALGVAATFLVSSVTWPHHLALAALPAGWLLVRLRDVLSPRGGRGPGAAAGAGAAAGLLAAAWLFLPLQLFEGRLAEAPLAASRTGALLVLFAGVLVTGPGRGAAAEGAT